MELTDEQLMASVKKGQLDLLNVLFKRYSKRIYNYFLKSTLEKADSDDLTQELFIRVLKYRNSYKSGQSVEIWVFQIARNMVKDYFGKMKVYKDRFTISEALPDYIDESNIEQQEKEQQLYLAMKELPEEQRELLVLSKFEKLKYEQIATLRKTSVGNIKVQVFRAIKELKTVYFSKELNRA